MEIEYRGRASRPVASPVVTVESDRQAGRQQNVESQRPVYQPAVQPCISSSATNDADQQMPVSQRTLITSTTSLACVLQSMQVRRHASTRTKPGSAHSTLQHSPTVGPHAAKSSINRPATAHMRPSSALPRTTQTSASSQQKSGVNSYAASALSAVRANVAADARMLLQALSVGNSPYEDLVMLQHIESSGSVDLHSTHSSDRVSSETQVRARRAHIGNTRIPAIDSQPCYAHKCISQVEINQWVEVRLQRSCTWVHNRVAEQCCICLEVMHLDESVSMLACGHRLHRPCIKRCFETFFGTGKTLCCPLCRSAITS